MAKDLTGQKFGRLTAKSRTSIKYKCGETRSAWVCECDCGNTKTIATPSLTNGRTKSCGCLHREIVFKGYEELSGQHWARIKDQAKRRNLDFNITIDQAWNLYIKQNRKCALSGVPIEFGSQNTSSLDRIDSSLGYQLKNIQWVHKTVNIMKNNLSDDEFIDWCHLITAHNR